MRDRARPRPLQLSVFDVETGADRPSGLLPLTPELLRDRPSGDVFGLTQNAGMGWPAAETGRDEFLILSTQGGVRAEDGTPVALGYHTGHWEVGLLVREAATELTRLGALPFAAHVSDPCDGRSQGTTGMFDSLPYRNDAAIVLRRLPGGARTRARCRRSAPASHNSSSRSKRRKISAVGLRDSRRRVPVSRDRGQLTGRRRSARADRTARRPRALGTADLA